MKQFALFGHPVAHSLSAKMHTASFKSIGFDGEYTAFDVPPENLQSELKRIVSLGYRGLNCTIPHKKAVMPFLDKLDESAIRYDAVNTILIENDGSTTGFNTDVYGFLHDLEMRDVKVKGAKILMLGMGGAGSALACGLIDAGCAELKIANRTLYTSDIIELGSQECIETARSSDIIINVTPIGLKESDPPALPINAFREGQVFYDCSPTSHIPSTVRVARIAGARSFDGKGFLVYQGAKAFEIWTGLTADTNAMFAVLA
jgi:shikimate dehydrogenase